MCTMMAGVLLVGRGADRARHRGALHPAAGRRRLHQRHRAGHRQHADPGLLRPADRSTCPASSWRDGDARGPRGHVVARGDRPGGRIAAGDARWRCVGCRRVPPATSLALVGGTAAVTVLGLHVETIGTRFGGIPSGLPAIHVPTFRPDLILGLLSPALTVAMLGAIESLMSAVVADRHERRPAQPQRRARRAGRGQRRLAAVRRPARDRRHRPDRHEHPLGRAHACGRIIHALTLLRRSCCSARRWPRYIPLPVLAAILLVVAWNMGEWREIPELLKLSRTDIAVWLVTFALTVVRRPHRCRGSRDDPRGAALHPPRRRDHDRHAKSPTTYVERGRAHVLQDKDIPDYVRIFRIHGPFLFGVTDKLDMVTRSARRAAAHRRHAAAEHDGDRRHRPAGNRESRGEAARDRDARCCSAARASSRRG